MNKLMSPSGLLFKNSLNNEIFSKNNYYHSYLEIMWQFKWMTKFAPSRAINIDMPLK